MAITSRVVPSSTRRPCVPGGVERQLGELLADLGDGVVRRHRAELPEQVQPVLDAAGVRRLQEREVCDVAQAERDHLQDDRGQVGAQDLRLGVFRSAHVVLFGVQPDGDAVAGAPASAGALVRGCLRDGLDRQPLDLRAGAVAADAGGAGVDHVLDAGHREAGLGDVGGEHDAAAGARRGGWPEHPVLVGGAQAAVEREHLGAGEVPSADGVLGIPDLRLAAEEHQHVAVALAGEFVDGGVDAVESIGSSVGGPIAVPDDSKPGRAGRDRRRCVVSSSVIASAPSGRYRISTG